MDGGIIVIHHPPISFTMESGRLQLQSLKRLSTTLFCQRILEVS